MLAHFVSHIVYRFEFLYFRVCPRVWIVTASLASFQNSLVSFCVKRGSDWPVQGLTAAVEQGVLGRAPIADNLVRSKSDLPLEETILSVRICESTTWWREIFPKWPPLHCIRLHPHLEYGTLWLMTCLISLEVYNFLWARSISWSLSCFFLI
jgi:hypothetical protein